MLNRSTCSTVEGGDDAADFQVVVAAMKSLGISEVRPYGQGWG